jgi:copper chaperone CopZ
LQFFNHQTRKDITMNQTFNVQGMTCGHCERTVTQAVKSVDPAAEVKYRPHHRQGGRAVRPAPRSDRQGHRRRRLRGHRLNMGTELPRQHRRGRALSGVSAKMVRHYESLGLLPRVGRTDSGYRQYSEAEVHTLQLHQAQRANSAFPWKKSPSW